MKKFLYSWVINTLAVLIAVYVVKGIGYDKPIDLIVAALVLGIFNALVRPILMLVALPLLVVTFGLFYFVINALLLYLVGYIMRPHFHVNTFWDAFWGGLVISLVSTALHIVTGTGKSAIRIERRRPPPGQGPDGGHGPIIDV